MDLDLLDIWAPKDVAQCSFYQQKVKSLSLALDF